MFLDRRDAGRQLIPRLIQFQGQPDTVVLGLARGGVVVASEIAVGLNLPLDVVLVRKIGAPGNGELAIGAIAEHGEGIFNQELIHELGVPLAFLKEEVERQKMLLTERLHRYRGKMPGPFLQDKTVILVDDGIATGASMRVAIQSVRKSGAKTIVLAVPVAAPDALKRISKEVDTVICLSSPAYFGAVGNFYASFLQTSDEEVVHLLHRSV